MTILEGSGGGEGGVQRIDCAKFTLTVSYNGNAIIKNM